MFNSLIHWFLGHDFSKIIILAVGRRRLLSFFCLDFSWSVFVHLLICRSLLWHKKFLNLSPLSKLKHLKRQLHSHVRLCFTRACNWTKRQRTDNNRRNSSRILCHSRSLKLPHHADHSLKEKKKISLEIRSTEQLRRPKTKRWWKKSQLQLYYCLCLGTENIIFLALRTAIFLSISNFFRCFFLHFILLKIKNNQQVATSFLKFLSNENLTRSATDVFGPKK